MDGEVMVTYRVLAEIEYSELSSVEDGFTPPPPPHGIAITAKDGKEIVGRNFLVSVPHVEGIWVAEKYRKGRVGFDLMRIAEDEAKSLGIKRLFAYGTNETNGYLERLGYKKQELTVWVKELICQQQR